MRAPQARRVRPATERFGNNVYLTPPPPTWWQAYWPVLVALLIVGVGLGWAAIWGAW